MERPQSIIWFERLYLGAFLIGILNTALRWQTMQEQLAANPASAMLGSWFVPITIAIGWSVSLLLWYFTARRRSNVTRWIVTVFFVISVLGIILSVVSGAYPADLSGIVGLVGLGLQGAAVWMLFKPDAKSWFERKSADLSDTFS